MKIDFTKIFNDFYLDITSKLPNIISAILVVIIFIILGKLITKLVSKRIQNKWKDNIISNFVSQVTKWFFYIFGIIIGLNLIGFEGVASNLVAGAGISAIVLGFAFKDIGENFLAGIILALKRPFEVGDIIEVEGFKGNVRDLDLRMTHLRNAEGKDIYIPNSTMIKSTLTNYTKDGYLRVSFIIGIAPESSIELTQKLILDYLNQVDPILKKPEPNVVVQELGEYTTNIQVLFWVNILANKKVPDGSLGRNIRSNAITKIKQILDENQIEMPSQVLEHKMYRDNSIIVKK